MHDQELCADSSPLIALAVAGALDLLPRIYRQIIVPPTVRHHIRFAATGRPGVDVVRAATERWLISNQLPEPAIAPLRDRLEDHGQADARTKLND
jgi:predicted nucleic acid-binding protein